MRTQGHACCTKRGMESRAAAGRVIAACALTLAACSSPQRNLAQSTEAALSWSATAHEVVRAWTGGLVPSAYARVALHAAHESLEQERTRLAASARHMDEERIATAASLLGSMSGTVSRMAQAIEQGDGAGLLRHEAELGEAEGRLKALVPAPDSGS